MKIPFKNDAAEFQYANSLRWVHHTNTQLTAHVCRHILWQLLNRIRSNVILIYRVSMKYFPDYKHLLQENYVEYKFFFTITLVSKISQKDGAPPHWGSHFRRFLDATFPNRWIGRDGPTPWPPRSPDITPLNFFLWGYVKDTSYRYYKFEGKNNRRFCYNNWRHVGEHVQRNWLSTRRSPCNKSSTCWSVLMCCKKKLLEFSYILKKNIYLYST